MPEKRRSWSRIEFDCPEPVSELGLRLAIGDFLRCRYTIRGRWSRYDPITGGVQGRPHTEEINLYVEHSSEAMRLLLRGHLDAEGHRVVFRPPSADNRMSQAAHKAWRTMRGLSDEQESC